MAQTTRSGDVYEIATGKIIEHLESGTVPWRKPWVESGLPQNLVTRKPYRGINLWMLNACGYAQNFFLTFRQVQQLKGKVKKNEKAHPVLFWKWLKKDPKDKRPLEEMKAKDLKAMLKYYLVFNVEQCTEIPFEVLPILTKPNRPLEAAEAILNGMETLPKIENGGSGAYYLPLTDTINMPTMESFVCSEAYYSTLFHEVVHSTGHESRLNRAEGMADSFGSESYSMEELIAEFGASYLSSHAGIVLDDHAASASYIEGWLKVLRGDKRFIVTASAKAQKAVEYVLGTNRNQ